MDVEPCYDAVIDEARRLWLEGSSNSQVVRYVLSQVPEWLTASNVYRKAFGVGFRACRAFHGLKFQQLDDKFVDHDLDEMIAVARIGRELTADRLAQHLNAPVEEIREAFPNEENRGQHARLMGGIRLEDAKYVKTESVALSDFLIELENKWLADRPRRYPYWRRQ